MHEITDEQRALYLRELLRRYGTLSLPLGSGLNFSLIQVFQPLRLRQSATEMQRHSANEHDKDQQDEREESEEKNEAELVENGIEALKKSPRGRLVILGSPGSGKTTVLKHLLSHHAHIALEESTAPLPIFLSLPDLARAGRDLDAYLAFIASDMGLDANDRHVLSHAIQQGHAFVCLDSLDEVLPGLRAGIIRQINELAQRSGNSWIVGSRFTEYKGGQFQQGQFQEWELQALDEPRRVQLAAQLLPELRRQLAAPTQHANYLDPHAYVQALNEHQQAATWGENPLLFSLGAVVYLRQGGLSGSRATLYREVIHAVLETREQHVSQCEQLRQLLADAALELYQSKGRTFSADDLRATLTRFNTEQQAIWNIEEMLFENDPGAGFVQRHLVHLLLVFRQVLLCPPQRFAVQSHMLLLSLLTALRSDPREQGHQYLIDLCWLHGSEHIAVRGCTRKARPGFRQDLLQPGSAQTNPLGDRLQGRFPSRFGQQDVGQHQRSCLFCTERMMLKSVS